MDNLFRVKCVYLIRSNNVLTTMLQDVELTEEGRQKFHTGLFLHGGVYITNIHGETLYISSEMSKHCIVTIKHKGESQPESKSKRMLRDSG